MKKRLFGFALTGALLAATPFAAMAAERGGNEHNGGGRNFSEGVRDGAREHVQVRRDFDRDRDDHDRGYRGGVYFNYSAPYSYGYTAPNPCGYYDAAGYWHADPACYGPAAVY
jgi:hypothetical protein